MISRYSDLYPMLQGDLPGIETPFLLHMLQQAGREFCLATEAWNEKLTYNIKDADALGDIAYDAAIAAGQSTAAADEAYDVAYDAALEYELKSHYDADTIRPWRVWTDGDEDDPETDPNDYEFDPATQKLRFLSALQTYSPTATTWATATAYAAGDYILSGDSTGYRYLCAIAHTSGTFATDLAASKWKAMPNDLIVRAILAPRLSTIELAGWFMEKWNEAIVARCKILCMEMKDKRWSSPERVPYFEAKYQQYVNRALRDQMVRHRHAGIMLGVPAWVP